MQNAREAWRRYVSVGQIAEPSLPAPVARGWKRCHELGTDPRRMRAEVLSPLETERLRATHAGLREAAAAYLGLLSRAAGNVRHAVMLSDGSGTILEVRGDAQSLSGPHAVPGPGSLLTEANAGTNGIGTALVENAYTEVIGAEHFIEGFHEFSCRGIPIRGPGAQIVGCLSVSLRSQEPAPEVRDLMTCAGQGIAAELVARNLEARLAEVRTAEFPLLGQKLEQLHQDLWQPHTAARLHLELAALQLRREQDPAALCRVAQTALQRFERAAAVWQLLAGSPRAAEHQPVESTAFVCELGELLQTEASIRGISLRVNADEPLVAGVVRPVRARALLRRFLCAFDRVERGGQVVVSTTARGLRWQLVPGPCPPVPGRDSLGRDGQEG
jgi:transcriptional regulator of acetoin/glycerol metabolism